MTLHLEERGTGVPVVLLHGTPTAPDHLLRLADRLAKGFRALVVHLPGYGRSAPLRPYALEKSYARIEDGLAARGIDEAHFVGFASGAYRALALACRGNVRALTIVSLAGSADFTADERRGLTSMVAQIRAGVALEPLAEQLMLSPRGRREAAWVAEIHGWTRATSREGLADELESIAAAPDLGPVLARLDVPILARVGSVDAISPLERSRRIADAARFVWLEEVPAVGHALLLEDFDATAASVERHLARTRTPIGP